MLYLSMCCFTVSIFSLFVVIITLSINFDLLISSNVFIKIGLPNISWNCLGYGSPIRFPTPEAVTIK